MWKPVLHALHVIDTETPNMVILDRGLPDLDGLAVLKKLRKKYKELPVLLLTARDSLADKVLGLDSGADEPMPGPSLKYQHGLITPVMKSSTVAYSFSPSFCC